MELLAHKLNLGLAMFANILWTIGQLTALYFMFNGKSEFNGWTVDDLLLQLGISQIYVYLYWSLYAENINLIIDKIIKGNLDFYLIKPINYKFLLSFEKQYVHQIIPFLQQFFLL